MRRRVLIAAAAAATMGLSGCGFTGLYGADLPGGADEGNHPFTVTAEFTNVLDLVPQSSVKVNDIPVGKVTDISLADHCLPAPAKDTWCAKVKVSVNDSVKLPANARAEVKQTSLLGEKYVSLEDPIGAAAPGMLKNGSKIGLQDTDSAPEVEEVLGALSLLLNDGGLQQIRVIASELNSALKGNEGAIRDLIGQLTTFTGTLDGQIDKITGALDNIDKLAITLNRQKDVLAAALDNFPPALKVLADERPKLTKLLVSLSNLGKVASGVINATQTNLVSALKSLDPSLIELARAGDALPGALRIAATFPFPLGRTRELVKGDYANLDADVNLNLTDTICGILGKAINCNPKAVGGNTKSSTKLPATTQSAGTTPVAGETAGSVGSSDMPSMIIGAGK